MCSRRMYCTLELSFLLLFAAHRSVFCDVGRADGFIPVRDKRYLVFPPPGDFAPTKVQIILGIGLPMEVDVSIIMGYVVKFNYVLPYNASYLTNPYVRYDRSIESDIDQDVGGAPPLRDEAVPVSRWDLYELLESALESTGSGKGCLLRAICEVAAAPFAGGQGLASEILRLILTPSTTSEVFRTEFDREYYAAELIGQKNAARCARFFPECVESFLEYFTQINS